MGSSGPLHTSRMALLNNPQLPFAESSNSPSHLHYSPLTSKASSEWRNVMTSTKCSNYAMRGVEERTWNMTAGGSSKTFPLWTTRRRLKRAATRTEIKTILATTTAAQYIKKSGEVDESTGEGPAAALRRILAAPGIHQGPACYDALSARLVEQAGFSYAFMSGFAVSAARLGAPDVGLLSYGEVLDQGRLITSAVSIPVIGDADNGYGNALNVKRTVKGFIQAGFAGILIEDQVSPKSCGHFGGKRVVSRDEALTRIKAAVDGRSEARTDIVIIARSDARQAESLEEALWRAQHFAQLGADVVFIDALVSKDEMVAFCKVAPEVPKMANMLEGGGRTPILTPLELDELGFKLVAYPLSLVGVSIRAMQNALKALKSGRLPPPGNLPSFDEIKDVLGMNVYYEEDKHFASLELSPASLPDALIRPEETETLPADSEAIGVEGGIPMLEGDIVSDIPEIPRTTGIPDGQAFVSPNFLDDNKDSSPDYLSAIWSRVLRVKITGSNGDVRLDVRIPAGFLEGLSSTIPGVAGLNLRALLDDSLLKLRGNLEVGQQLLDISDRRGERIQVFLE